MQQIHAMGITTDYLEQLDVVMLLRQALTQETKIEAIEDVEHRFGINSKEFCWSFGADCDDLTPWIDQMQADGYTFEGSTLFVDQMGFVAGLWVNAEQAPEETESSDTEEEESEEDSEPEVKAVSETEITAMVKLKCTDEDGKITRLKVRGKYRKHRQEGFFVLVDVIDINKDKDLKEEDIQEVLAWTNQCNMNLLDFTIEGPAYTATQAHVHNFGIQRICVDQLHAAVLDKMISSMREMRNGIQLPVSVTEMTIDGK